MAEKLCMEELANRTMDRIRFIIYYSDKAWVTIPLATYMYKNTSAGSPMRRFRIEGLALKLWNPDKVAGFPNEDELKAVLALNQEQPDLVSTTSHILLVSQTLTTGWRSRLGTANLTPADFTDTRRRSVISKTMKFLAIGMVRRRCRIWMSCSIKSTLEVTSREEGRICISWRPRWIQKRRMQTPRTEFYFVPLYLQIVPKLAAGRSEIEPTIIVYSKINSILNQMYSQFCFESKSVATKRAAE
jgi:hypothetical protein